MTQPAHEDDVFQVVVEGTNEGTPWAWVRHWRLAGESDVNSVAAALASHYETNILPDLAAMMNEQWSQECITVSRVAPVPMNVFFQNSAPPLTGAVEEDGVPNTSALVIRLQSDETGARNRGRCYFCGLPETYANGGRLTSAGSTAAGTFAAGLIDTCTVTAGVVCTPVIFSRTAYGPAAPHPANADDYTAAITAVEVENNLGTIRNRRYPRNAIRDND